MEEYVIDLSEDTADAKLEPETTVEEIMQNIRTLLSTFKGQVPYDRGFGLSKDIMDLPPGRAMVRMQIEIIEAVQKYEPRAEVVSVDFDGEKIGDGILYPKVSVKI